VSTDKSVQLVVKGLPQLTRGFKQIDANLKNTLKDELLPVAKNVAGVVQQRMPFGSGRAAESIAAKSSNYGASIAAYGQKAPYGPWLDFGGSTGRGHKVGVAWSGAIKREWRGVPKGSGRYLYPGIEDAREDTAKAVEDAVARAAQKADFEVRG
jgi:phage gpG-like protein